jgi:hypothetical protein
MRAACPALLILFDLKEMDSACGTDGRENE